MPILPKRSPTRTHSRPPSRRSRPGWERRPPPARPSPSRCRCSPPRSRPRLHKLGGPQPARGTRPGRPGTGLTPRSQPAGAPAQRPRARLPRAPSPQPRSARSPGALVPARPRAACGERPGAPRHRAPPPGSGLRPSGRSGGSGGHRRAAGGGRRAAGSGRPALHMLTRAARGQRPAPPGPRDARAQRLPAPGRGRRWRGGGSHPAPARETSPAGAATRAAAEQKRCHPLSCTHTHTASLAVIHTPGKRTGAHTPTHVYTNTVGTAAQTSMLTHSLRYRHAGTDAHCVIRTPNHCFTDTLMPTFTHDTGLCPTHSETAWDTVTGTRIHTATQFAAH